MVGWGVVLFMLVRNMFFVCDVSEMGIFGVVIGVMVGIVVGVVVRFVLVSN